MAIAVKIIAPIIAQKEISFFIFTSYRPPAHGRRMSWRRRQCLKDSEASCSLCFTSSPLCAQNA